MSTDPTMGWTLADHNSTLFLSHAPGTVSELSDQILGSMLAAGRANQETK